MEATLFAFAPGDVERRVGIPSVDAPLADLAQAINGSLDYSRTLIQNLNNTSSDIAHNLKKPLTRLRQRLEVASKCEAGNPEFSGKIDEGIREIDSLVAMFEALLNFGQLQSGDWRSRFVDVDMPALLTHIIDVYDPIIADHGLRLEAFISRGRVRPVRGDRELLMEMIVNFLENSIQYCPEGTTLRIDMHQGVDGLNISVSDNGPGVPTLEIENLLQRFYRLEVARDKPGHGLGIPFAVAIADLHGARIELSDNKPGLNVFIHFPNVPDTRRPQLGLRLRSGYVVKDLSRD
jgi:signal transduction histidine kinase